MNYMTSYVIYKLVKAPSPAKLRAVLGVCPPPPTNLMFLFLSSLWSDLSMSGVRYLNLRHIILRGNAH